VHFSLENGEEFLSDTFIFSVHESMRQLLSEITVDHNRKVGDVLQDSPKKLNGLKDFIRGNIKVDSHYLSDGTVEVTGEIPLNESMRKLFIEPPAEKGVPIVQLLCPLCNQPWPEGRGVPKHFEQIINTSDISGEHHSGLVILVKDLVFFPCLSPRIINEEGQVIYDATFADISDILRSGLVSYHRTGDDIEIAERVGEHPMMISSIGVAGKNRTDFVISVPDSKMVHSSFHNMQHLSQCKVAIVLVN
jgi:hypothetical protein